MLVKPPAARGGDLLPASTPTLPTHWPPEVDAWSKHQQALECVAAWVLILAKEQEIAVRRQWLGVVLCVAERGQGCDVLRAPMLPSTPSAFLAHLLL